MLNNGMGRRATGSAAKRGGDISNESTIVVFFLFGEHL
jgi:hypothetical protein